ncbi:MAG TPA: hypothetical protein VMV27_14490 [Candidatus Binataceae bacterium]|nr:hypothetical protein [Candidatus Binataceae bacterium]
MADEIRVNGVAIGIDAEETSRAERAMVLPSGREAVIRKGYGRDLMRAQRATVSDDPAAVLFALIAELVEIDGRRIVYEDVLGMDLGDVLALQAEVIGANFQLPPPADSQVSCDSDSH